MSEDTLSERQNKIFFLFFVFVLLKGRYKKRTVTIPKKAKILLFGSGLVVTKSKVTHDRVENYMLKQIL